MPCNSAEVHKGCFAEVQSLVILSPLDHTKRVAKLHIPDPGSDSKVTRYLG